VPLSDFYDPETKTWGAPLPCYFCGAVMRGEPDVIELVVSSSKESFLGCIWAHERCFRAGAHPSLTLSEWLPGLDADAGPA
jgi:hypothetical protein